MRPRETEKDIGVPAAGEQPTRRASAKWATNTREIKDYTAPAGRPASPLEIRDRRCSSPMQIGD